MASYTCSLTGLPATDPVVTPSGHIASKSLLLTKLSENGGVDPFDPSSKRSLDESDLIHLAPSTTQNVPPRPPSTTSLPSILKVLQDEFDCVLLELYDTRKALEETRRELSTALYQNDAAVRVIARVCGERDELRGRLEGMMSGASTANAGGGAEKRSREDESEVEPAKKAKVDTTNSIPASDMEAMIETWNKLSVDRRLIAKLKRTPEEISVIESNFAKLTEKKVNVHKSNSNGVIGLNALQWNDENYVVSIGKDGQIIVYNVTKGVIGHTIPCAGVSHVHAMACDDILYLCACTSNEIKLFSVQEEATLVSSMDVDTPIGVSIHPSSSKGVVRIMVVTPSNAMFVRYSEGVKEMEVLVKLEDSNNNSNITTGELHPDGIIYAMGTEGGKLIVWDLKTLNVASTLDVSEGNPITNITFSENGYHIATSTPSTFAVWDLRKQKMIGSVEERVNAAAFDPSASYIAYGVESAIKVCKSKELDTVVATYEYEKKKGGKAKKKKAEDEVIQGGLVWGAGAGDDKIWLASGCDGEKPVRFWGIE